jgi:hypothetical protein
VAERSTTPIVIAILGAGILIAVAIFFSRPEPAPKPKPDAFERVKAAVASQLSDPVSAQFRGMEQKVFGYCGEVNPKNRMGGYVGFMKFHAYEQRTDKWEITLNDQLVAVMCK